MSGSMEFEVASTWPKRQTPALAANRLLARDAIDAAHNSWAFHGAHDLGIAFVADLHVWRPVDNDVEILNIWTKLTLAWPFVIGLANILVNSCFVPSRFGFTQSTIVQYSIRLFCSGVPVSITRRLVFICFSAFAICAFSFFMRWPSSQMTNDGPGSSSALI